MRCTALCIKYDPSELDNMSDYQFIEQHNDMSSIDREMREIFDIVTALSEIVALW